MTRLGGRAKDVEIKYTHHTPRAKISAHCSSRGPVRLVPGSTVDHRLRSRCDRRSAKAPQPTSASLWHSALAIGAICATPCTKNWHAGHTALPAMRTRQGSRATPHDAASVRISDVPRAMMTSRPRSGRKYGGRTAPRPRA
jgi:hypothetical protein